MYLFNETMKKAITIMLLWCLLESGEHVLLFRQVNEIKHLSRMAISNNTY